MCVGLYGRVARVHHPKLDPIKRLSFAQGYLNFGLKWYDTIFADEMCVWTGHNGRVRSTKYSYNKQNDVHTN